MKKIFVAAAVALLALTLAPQSLKAQRILKDWNGIDEVSVSYPVSASSCNTLYVVVDHSSVKLASDYKYKSKVESYLDAFSSYIEKTVKKAYPNMQIKTVALIPATLGENEMALRVAYSQFSLDNAPAMAVKGELFGQDKAKLLVFSQHAAPSNSPADPGATKAFEEAVAGDVVKIFNGI